MTGRPGPGGGELGAEARALLDAAREGLSPDPAAARRVHARVQAATAGAAAGSALAIKLGVLGLAVVVAVGAVIYAGRGRDAVADRERVPAVIAAPPARAAAPVAVAAASAAAAAVNAAPPASASPAAPAICAAPAASSVAAEPPAAAHDGGSHGNAHGGAPAVASVARAASAPRSAATGDVPAAGAGIALGREVELVDHAMAALRRGDADGALRVVQEYAAEAAGSGQLGQDIAAIEIEALCQLRDPAARDRLAAFDARFPHSAQRARLASACR